MFFEDLAFCASDNFARTFVDIRFMKIAQERLASMLIRVYKIFNCQASFKILLSELPVIVENEL